jgi:hypothetical protein
VSATFSRRSRRISVIDCKQLVLFLIVPVVYDFARGDRAPAPCLTVIITVGAHQRLVGIVQYGILNYDNLGRRMQGTLSHWMTYSGTLMLVICAATGRLLFGSRDRAVGGGRHAGARRGADAHAHPQRLVGAAPAVGVLLLLKDFRLVGAAADSSRPGDCRGAGGN